MYDWDQPKTLLGKWIMPPHLPADDEIELFAEELIETCEQKLKECHRRKRELKRQRKEALVQIPENDSERLVYLETENLYYSEWYAVDAWAKYWLALHDKAAQIEPYRQVDADSSLTNQMIDTAREYGIEPLYDGDLRVSGSRKIGKCPFHNEKTGSFVIYDDGHAKCFGCQWYGNAIDFLMKRDNIEFIDAVRRLQ